MALADDIQMAERHVLQAERHVKCQRARIAALKRRRLPRGKASNFLQLLEDAQSLHLQHLSQLLERASREKATPAGRLAVLPSRLPKDPDLPKEILAPSEPEPLDAQLRA